VVFATLISSVPLSVSKVEVASSYRLVISKLIKRMIHSSLFGASRSAISSKGNISHLPVYANCRYLYLRPYVAIDIN